MAKKGFFKRLRKDQRGASMLEYTMLLGLITAGVITFVSTVGTEVSTTWNTFSTKYQLP